MENREAGTAITRKFSESRESASPKRQQGGTGLRKESKTSKQLGLSDLIGLRSVKETIEVVMKRVLVERELAERDLGIDPGPMNFVFKGNPGTAKTTVATILANEFYEKGILPTNKVVQAGRKDVIARYEGQTTAKMKHAFQRAEGGVLFIDEAYSLVERWGGEESSGFGKEAIDTLVEELGVPRSDRVVILAGYPDEMDEFIRTNPGLISRLNYMVDFPDYDAEELFAILSLHAKNKNLTISSDAKGQILPRLEVVSRIKCFGNGRFAVNLLEKAINRQRVRLYDAGIGNISVQDAVTLKAEDFSDIEAMISALGSISESDPFRKVGRIGFAPKCNN